MCKQFYTQISLKKSLNCQELKNLLLFFGERKSNQLLDSSKQNIYVHIRSLVINCCFNLYNMQTTVALLWGNSSSGSPGSPDKVTQRLTLSYLNKHHSTLSYIKSVIIFTNYETSHYLILLLYNGKRMSVLNWRREKRIKSLSPYMKWNT